MTSLEDKLISWTGPSSATEQDKQDRTERMVSEAVRTHPGLKDCTFTVYTKGSYPNRTNVKADSDVDVAVQCSDVFYWDAAEPGAKRSTTTPYTGVWTPSKLRTEVLLALEQKFPGQVDASGSTAIKVNSSTARVDADVLPCFDYRYYLSSGAIREGARAFKTNGNAITNYPEQQLKKGIAKNEASATRFKKAVRVLKRIENAMVEDSLMDELPSYFMECLVYNVPNSILTRAAWVEVVRGILGHIYVSLEGPEPEEESVRWLEVNECKFLFHQAQKWSRADGRALAQSAWSYLGYPNPT
ncbi:MULTISPECIES: nucleotidyltransferase domain-containing protein [Mycobacterium avium complex (MAC)]|uniref:nucleotidyltransferase domain-containing protein n=1 Tax=Mycobacterium avium complex (MAC) TaxID=120793 RepID=UPI0007A09EA8|nr:MULTISPECIES: nucleotidyltransferase [Mycobacterium avium complex (MAC)]MCA2247652.1 nucleotidyltransferase [Mycobacterium intracellulare]MDV3219404.1 nucleotidyltransferase [Mycobacterium avium]